MASLNPFTLIERLIEEHGSSSIQGKHLALLKEQITILKQQIAEGDQKMAELQSRNEQLQAENSNLRQQINELTASARQQRTACRSKRDEQILLLLTNRQNRTAREIAAKIAVSVDRCEALLDALHEADLVGCQSFYRMEFEAERPSEWYLTTEGKHYLARHDLIQ